MSSDISILIPCYNSGEYLPDALESIKNSTASSISEVIIVNDGSTDPETLLLLGKLEEDGYKIIHQDNMGPAAARNTGVKAASNDYILFLDSDNKIRENYINRSIDILNKNEEVGVVYGDPYFFGNTTSSRFHTQDFDIVTILMGNYIDMCSIVRKKMMQELGGLDESIEIIGHEDWEFWIRAGAAGWKFHHIKEVMYDYRVREDSLVKQALQNDKYEILLQYIYTKHYKVLIKNYKNLFDQNISLYRQQLDLNKKYKESNSYRLGNLLIFPFSRIKSFLKLDRF